MSKRKTKNTLTRNKEEPQKENEEGLNLDQKHPSIGLRFRKASNPVAMAGCIQAASVLLILGVLLAHAESEDKCALIQKYLGKLGCHDGADGPQVDRKCQRKYYAFCKNNCTSTGTFGIECYFSSVL